MPLWEPRRRIELAYQRALERLLKQALFTCRDCSSYAAFKRAMDAWSKTEEFREFSEALAGKMITGLFADVGRNWREAARYNSKTREMYMRLIKSMAGERGRRVQEMIRENAELIQTLPLSTAEQVSDYAAEQAAKGRRPEDIEAEILKLFPNRTRARSKLIARTEMAKYHTAMIQADCQDLGHNWYFWRSVRDERSRSAHKKWMASCALGMIRRIRRRYFPDIRSPMVDIRPAERLIADVRRSRLLCRNKYRTRYRYIKTEKLHV